MKVAAIKRHCVTLVLFLAAAMLATVSFLPGLAWRLAAWGVSLTLTGVALVLAVRRSREGNASSA
jgi:predicted phage tail protein